ncbi:MAG: hypothetical protein SOZ59_10620 [Candidatus Limivivens sp.]|nr:hypothetical protein [Candidatus Limivivens sp.]
MAAFRRSVRYWSRVLGEIILMGAAGSACMVVISLFGSSSVSRTACMNMAALAWILVASMVMIVFTVGWFENYMPVLLAFGCRRKEAFLGMEGAKILISAVLALIEALLLQIENTLGQTPWETAGLWLLFFLLMCIVSSLGEILGGIYHRFGKIVLFGVGILCGILGGGLGYIMGSVMGENMDRLFQYIRNFQEQLWIVGFAGMILLVLSAVCSGLLMRRAEARL